MDVLHGPPAERAVVVEELDEGAVGRLGAHPDHALKLIDLGREFDRQPHVRDRLSVISRDIVPLIRCLSPGRHSTHSAQTSRCQEPHDDRASVHVHDRSSSSYRPARIGRCMRLVALPWHSPGTTAGERMLICSLIQRRARMIDKYGMSPRPCHSANRCSDLQCPGCVWRYCRSQTIRILTHSTGPLHTIILTIPNPSPERFCAWRRRS